MIEKNLRMETQPIGIDSDDFGWEKKSYDSKVSSKTYDLLIGPLIIDGALHLRLYEYENSKARELNHSLKSDLLFLLPEALDKFIIVFQSDNFSYFIKHHESRRKR